jgi:predicted nucleic acid-binding protein
VPKYALDTNVYVAAGGSAPAAAALKDFLRTHLARTFLSAVVVQELRVGARTQDQVSAVESGIIEPFMRRGRVFAPSARAFHECGRILADLITREGLAYADAKRSLVNDVLIATSCREQGITLVTSDRDFDRIARYLKGFRRVASLPR